MTNLEIKQYVAVCNKIGSFCNWKAVVNDEFGCIVVLVNDNYNVKHSYVKLYPTTKDGVASMINTMYDADLDELEEEAVDKLVQSFKK